MARISLLVAAVVPVIVFAVACKEDPPPATPIAPSQSVQPNPSAAPPGYNQPGYNQPGYTPAPTGSTPAPGQMATPGPTALACQNDSQCMTHKCNLQHQRCAFPCVSDFDCIQGTTCFVAGGPAAICMPKPAGSP